MAYHFSPHVCPVCGKYIFPRKESFDICPVCVWEDDWYQLTYPDEDCCANQLSLNQAREAYRNGNRKKVYKRPVQLRREPGSWLPSMSDPYELDDLPDKEYNTAMTHRFEAVGDNWNHLFCW